MLKASTAALALCLLSRLPCANAQPAAHEWKAGWITHPSAPLREPVVLHFRKIISLPSVPANFPVQVSADNRFVLYVNGKRVGDGPARGDLDHWRYQEFDLAPYLTAGDNRITATVWNFGIVAPVAQISDRTAFLLEGEGDAAVANTGPGWQVEVENGQQAYQRDPNGVREYFASGPGELFDGDKYDWDWQTSASRGAWVDAASPMRENIYSHNATARDATSTSDTPWGLIPDALPHMSFETTDAGHVVRTTLPGVLNFPAASLKTQTRKKTNVLGFIDFPGQSLTIPANTKAHVLFDRSALITAYPALTVDGGKGAHIGLTYSEALYDSKHKKGDRNDVGDRVALGIRDEFLPDGGQHRTFETLWWRTWRYLDLDIETGGEPLTLRDITAHATMYPFERQASFHSTDPGLAKIWEISWRTASLDAHETYMDTPYYEQLQYIGDTRIQALISYAVTGEDRLARQAIRAFDDSRRPEGITESRYPTAQPQIIPPFSLLWIGMLHDYWMYRPDAEFVRQALPGSRAVLAWFSQHEAPDHLLLKLPWWSFIDWTSEGKKLPVYGPSEESCVTSLQYLGALGEASELEAALGNPYFAQQDKSRADALRSALYNKCWDEKRQLLADNPEKTAYGEQANILAVLYDVVPQSAQKPLLERIFSIQPGHDQGDVLAATYYFRFYFARALDHAGMADRYLESLTPWRVLLPLHFSTWPEVPGDTRSDSHAWSAHPIYDLLTLVAGVEPAAPGFATVKIAPHLGSLQGFDATYPHPRGKIVMSYRRAGKSLKATVIMPGGLGGVLEWNGKQTVLHPGTNALDLQ